MAQSILTLIIKTVKEGGGDTDTVKGLVSIKSGLLEMGIVAAAVTGVVAGVDQVLKATVGEFVNYGKEVDIFSTALGTSTEQGSRLIQISDQLGISEGQLQTWMLRAVKLGIDPTVAGLEKMADQYNALATPQAKALFLIQTFGRSSAEMGRLLAEGSAGIEAMNNAVQSSLVFDDEAKQKADALALAENRLNEQWSAIKIGIGNNLVGPITDLLALTNKADQETEHNQVSWMKYVPILSAVYSGYHTIEAAIDLTKDKTGEQTSALNAGKSELDEYNKAILVQANLSAQAATVLGQYGDNIEVTTAYENAYNDALENGKTDTEAVTEATKAADDAVKLLQKAVEDKTSWEVEYTNAKDVATQIEDTTKLLGTDIQSILGQTGEDGALVWNGFLAATGQISPAAAKQFVQIESDYEKVKAMLAAGIAVDVVVNWLLNETSAEAAFHTPQTSDYYGTGGAASSSGGKIKLASWASPADIAYAEAHPDIYDLSSIPGKAGGADFIVPPGFPNDSYPIRVESGEHVVVTPAGSENNTNNYYNSVMEQYSASPTIHMPGGPGGAEGLDVIVPPGYPNDSYPVRAQSGEHVTVTPAGSGFDTGALESLIITLINQIKQQRNEIQRLPTLFAAELMKLVK